MKRILVVEDEEALALSLKDNLTAEGYVVDLAKDGEIALVQIAQNKPDLVLLDLLLPKRDGLSVLETIKKNPDFKAIPVVVLSNLGSDIKLPGTAGDFSTVAMYADDYLIKAQNSINDIVKKINEYIGSGKKAKVVETRG